MKKTLTCIALLTILTGAQAQYKKASFFSKAGRYYEVGTNRRLLKDGRSGGTGIYFSMGQVNPGNHVNFGFDLEYVGPAKYNYITENRYDGSVFSTGPVTNVSAKSGFSVLFRYNVGYIFGNTANENAKLFPFINGHLGGQLGSDEASYTYDEHTDPAITPVSGIPALVYGISGGVLFKATKSIGIQASYGYNGLAGIEAPPGTNKVFQSHTYVAVGLRLTLTGEKN